MKTLQKTLTAFLVVLVISVLPMTVFGQEKGKIQYLRPYDYSGVNIFEMPKQTDITFDGFRMEWGAAFRQQWQSLNHENDADPNIDPNTGADLNALSELGPGFNTANANLFLDAMLAEGVRVHVTTYLSSRHHREAWVKGGYLQFDALPMLNSEVVDNLMKNIRIKVGHYEVDYGDQHYRRSDNAQALYNPFVGNYIMDPFTTEIGGQVYYLNNGVIAMIGITGGEIKGDVSDEATRTPAYYGKLGYDNRAEEGLRFRLTGSFYATEKSNNNTLYFGDRAGSHYFGVIEGGDFSGRVNPGLNNEVTSFMINPFIKYEGFELFGTYETTTGNGFGDPNDRSWDQIGVEAIYRFLENEQLYLGARYNTVSGELPFSAIDVSIDRIQLAAGWYMTEKVLMKIEYVNQTYDDYPTSNIRHDGSFDGIVIEGVVAF